MNKALAIILLCAAPGFALTNLDGTSGGAASSANFSDSSRACFIADTCAVQGTTYTVYDSTKVDSAVYAETLLIVPDSALASQRSDTATYALNASAADSSFKIITGTNSDTLQIDSLVRAKAFYGDGSNLTGVSGTPDSSYKIITADSTATDAIGSKTGTTTIGGTGSTIAWGGIVSALKGLTIPAYSVAAGDTLYGRIFNSTADSVIYIGGKKVDRSADSLLIFIDLTP